MSQSAPLHFSKQVLFGVGLAAAITLFSTALYTHQVSAQALGLSQSLGITAIPPRLGENFELKAKPGEKIQTILKVRNSSDEALPVKTLVEDFILSEDGSTPIPVKDQVSNRWSLASWITVSPANQVVGPREIANVNVIIDVPADALPGGHYAMVLHTPDLSSPENASPFVSLDSGSQSGIGQRVGTLIYFLVDGPINEEAFIRDFKMPRFTEFGPVPMAFTVENVSDVHIRPQIGIEIYNMFGQKVDTVQVEAKNVFPFVARNFESEWDRVWGMGWYSAKLVMSYGSEGQIAVAKTSFWLIPIKLVLAFIFTVLSLIGLSVSIRRHLLHRQDLAKKKVEMLEQRLAELEKAQEVPSSGPTQG